MKQKHQDNKFSEMDLPWEGVFERARFRKLRLSRRLNAESSYEFLCRQIQRYPKKLAFHFCRIKYAIKMKDSEILYAAVLDLFYVLDSKGNSLRKKILDNVGNLMNESHRTHLQRVLNGDLSSRHLPFSSRSILHDGVKHEDSIELFDTSVKAQQSVLDPVNTARMCLEAGQLDQAQEILESQLEIEPERAEVRRDLLEIYCATKDEHGFKTSYQILEIRGHLDEEWKQVASDFAIAS
ncbi:MAG: hypothetical protein K0U68_15910 [Gammaproteobacteria bacterium]|nr:hypothetical protein [Gammaproteobacteria bacterium]